MRKLGKRLIISLLIILILGACDYCSVPVGERFTYRVRYTVEDGTSGNAVNVTYIDENNNPISPSFTPPSTFTLEFTCEYDYTIGSEFYPELTITTNLNAGDSITMTISWEDYKVNFEEETLSTITITGPIVVDQTLHAGPLPP